MLDENAFGLLIAYHHLEDDEYAGERADFVERYRTFAKLVRERLAAQPPAARARAVDLGHALYVELLSDDEPADLIAWLRGFRALLAEHAYQTAAFLTFGAAWVEEAPGADVVECGSVKLLLASLPSEPLRRALLGEAATHADEDDGEEGWGPGLYLDVDAVEALGRKPKNAPTVLRAGGAAFFRAGS
jgi:hypothetical protein